MQKNDKGHVVGTVMDIVGGNVLLNTDDGHEYWFIEKHVLPLTETSMPQEAETPAKPGKPTHPPSGEETADVAKAAPAHEQAAHQQQAHQQTEHEKSKPAPHK